MHSVHNLPANLSGTDKELIKLVKRTAWRLRNVAIRMEKLNNWDMAEEYFEDIFDIDFSIDARVRYRSVKICLAMGGPVIYFNTATGEVTGIWGFHGFYETVEDYVCYAVDDYFENYFDTFRKF